MRSNLNPYFMFFISEASKAFVELPPELCSIIMSPIKDSIIYSFSFIPSIMHRIESLLVAFNLKKMHLDHCAQNETQIMKVCTIAQEKFMFPCVFFFGKGSFICRLIVFNSQKSCENKLSYCKFSCILYIYISSCVSQYSMKTGKKLVRGKWSTLASFG